VSAGIQTLHVFRLYWAQERGNLAFLLEALLMPAMLVYLGMMIVADDPEGRRFWMAGSLTFSLGLEGLGQVGHGILDDRFRGRLRLIRTSPITKRAYLGGQLSVAVLQSILIVIAGLTAFSLLGVAEPTGSGIAWAILAGACAGGAIGTLAAVIALGVRSVETGTTAIGIASIALSVASPVFYSLDAVPALLRPLAWLSPFTHVAPLVRAVLAGAPVPLASLAAIVALTVLFAAVGSRWVRWER
jgi:ABC-type multidrug transport system permease subunit